MNKIINGVLKRISVRITYNENIGSGVLLSLDGKTILMTALHVLNGVIEIDEPLLCIERYSNDSLVSIPLTIDAYVPLVEVDIAVIQIKTECEVDKIECGVPQDDCEALISGYPGILHKNDVTQWYYITGVIKDCSSNNLCVEINEKLGSISIDEKSYVNGFSGGGIFTEFDDQLWLCGIETRALTHEVAYNCVCGIPVELILKLIEEKSSLLSVSLEKLFENYNYSYQIKRNEYYGKQLFVISDYEYNLPLERIENEYRAGIDAHPEHIRHHLDVVRAQRMQIISKYLDDCPILIIRGASGQGKTTLALRYLMDNYKESQIIVIRNVSSEATAIELIHSLKTTINDDKYVLFYDVNPGDKYWKGFLKAASDFGIGAKVLVAIREEDFNTNSVTGNEFSYNELHLWLTEEEAREIYSKYNSGFFVSFDAAWKEFGYNGPLLEFSYSLNHSESLQDKITSQIQQIEEEEDAAEWFLILGVIAIAGMYNVKIPVTKLFERVVCKSKNRLLRRFVEELFIKDPGDRTYIECLHAIRAKLILQSLNEEMLFDYCQALLTTISIVDNNITYMVIDYIYRCGINRELIKKLARINYISLKGIEGVLRSLLWCSVYQFLKVNENSILEGNRLFSNQYLMLALGDITGKISTGKTSDTLLDVFEEIKPGIKDKAKRINDSLPQRYLEYELVSYFLNEVKDSVISLITESDIDGYAAGYVLFWAALCDIKILVEELPRIIDEDCIAYLHLLKGLNMQQCNHPVEEIKQVYGERILACAGIIATYKCNEEIYAYIVNDIEKPKGKKQTFSSICVRAVHVMRILEPSMDRYNAQLLGEKLDGIQVPDLEKHIQKENLFEKWVTELNHIGCRLEEYKHAPKNWSDVYSNIIDYRRKAIELLSEFNRVLDKYLYKGKTDTTNLSSLLSDWTGDNPFSTPKCALDIYGLRDNNSLDDKEGRDTINSDKEHKKEGFEDSVQKYSQAINDCINQITNVLQDLACRKNGTLNYRLAYYSIVAAYEECKTFQEQCKEYFSNRIIDLDEQQELTVLQKTAAILGFVFANGYKQQKNALYNSNEEIKKGLRKIDDYLCMGIGNIEGVISLKRDGKIVVIRSFIDAYEKVLNSVYKSIKSLIGGRTDISITKAYFVNVVNSIRFQLIDSNEKEVYQITVKTNLFTITDECSELAKYLMFETERLGYISELDKWNEYGNSLIMLLNRIIQINQGILDSSVQYINKPLAHRIDSSYRKIFEELKTLVDQCNDPRKETVLQRMDTIAKMGLIITNADLSSDWSYEVSMLMDEVGDIMNQLN